MEIQTILHKLKIQQLSDMQRSAIDAVLHTDKDIVLLSPTGTGKTLAYLLPMSQCVNQQLDALQMVVVVPGRELALQSCEVLKSMGTGLRGMSLYGGRPAMDEHRVLRQVKPQVVFATPGRLNDHIDKGNIDISTVRYLVIDEFDKCLNMRFEEEMQAILGKLPSIERRLLLSATDMDEIPRFVSMKRSVTVDYLQTSRPSLVEGKENGPQQSAVVEDADGNNDGGLTLCRVESPDKDKLETLDSLLRNLGSGSSIVFLNYRESVERTSAFLTGKGFIVSTLHGGMEQRQREDQLYKFSNGSANILVATDLASRGLDILNVSNIIHYHLPETQESYVHRTGRTARWDASGQTIFILSPDETLPAYINAGQVGALTFAAADSSSVIPVPKMATLYIGKGKKDKISKGDIVGFLCKIGGLQPMDIGRIDVRERYAYAAVTREKLHVAVSHANNQKIKGIKTVVESVR